MSAGIDLTPVYYVKYDDTGRIVQHGMESSVLVRAAIASGEKRIITGPRDLLSMADPDYVDLSGDAPVVKARPVFDRQFDTNPVAPNVEATLPELPKCRVTIKGPINGQVQHDGGDFKLGSSLPGDYEISFEAWPYMPATLALTVGS